MIDFTLVSDLDAVFAHRVDAGAKAEGIIAADMVDLGHRVNEIVK